MIKAISFDVWNTLMKIDVLYKKLAESIYKHYGSKIGNIDIVYEKIRAVYLKAKEMRRRAEFDESRIVEESCRMMAKGLGLRLDQLKKCLVKVFASIPVEELLFEDTLKALRALREQGFMIAIVGNTLFWPSALTRLILHRSSIDELVDVAIFSDEVGVSKPDRRIFIELCNELGIEAARIAHVGDGVVEDVGGALSAGMYGILIDRGAEGPIVIKRARVAVISNLMQIPKVIKELV